MDEAVARFESVLADCVRVLGPDHWLTADARRSLEATQEEATQETAHEA